MEEEEGLLTRRKRRDLSELLLGAAGEEEDVIADGEEAVDLMVSVVGSKELFSKLHLLLRNIIRQWKNLSN